MDYVVLTPSSARSNTVNYHPSIFILRIAFLSDDWTSSGGALVRSWGRSFCPRTETSGGGNILGRKLLQSSYPMGVDQCQNLQLLVKFYIHYLSFVPWNSTYKWSLSFVWWSSTYKSFFIQMEVLHTNEKFYIQMEVFTKFYIQRRSLICLV